MRGRDLGGLASLAGFVSTLVEREGQIRTKTVSMADFKVRPDGMFEVDGTELYVKREADRVDDLPLKQLCGTISMNYGFYNANPGALNSNIFETRFRPLSETDKGQRIIRYREMPEGGNRLLAILPTAHRTVGYAEALRPLVAALPSETVIRAQNVLSVDDDHRMSFRLTFPNLWTGVTDRAEGEEFPIELGLFMEMSEDGLGALRATSMVYQLVCSNGAMVTYDKNPLFSYNYRGLTAPDLVAALSSAFGRFEEEARFLGTKINEAQHETLTKADALEFLKELETRRDFSKTFLRRVRKEVDAKDLRTLTRWDAIAAITEEAQNLPHTQRVNHEFAAGRVLGLALTAPAAAVAEPEPAGTSS